MQGTLEEVCDKDSGKCLCKEGFGGPRCDQVNYPFYKNVPFSQIINQNLLKYSVFPAITIIRIVFPATVRSSEVFQLYAIPLESVRV